MPHIPIIWLSKNSIGIADVLDCRVDLKKQTIWILHGMTAYDIQVKLLADDVSDRFIVLLKK